MTDRDRPLLAVLIDADNVPAKHAAKIMREVASIGEPALRRVYGDWSNEHLKGWREPIRTLGLVAHQETNNSRGKNATDIGLVIHAMDILHSGKFDMFVIVSSDSDFTALVNRLREDGLTVIGIGEQKTNESLRNVYNRFILIENIPDPDAPAVPVKGSAADKALPLFREAFDKIDSEDDWYNLGQIGQAIQARHPDFDSRTYGYGKLSALVSALDTLETQKLGNRMMVRPKD
ncbi:OST-HTH/LOTUS domain-containing protein [Sulfitobacter brevis]|uniref:OST-HTH/LOTUS domain-containing protein n=1 Tax=Sulfitobacter brevis TaxID=74348 RepID=A0A1I1URK4_9RHOB|nr:NYN domain-containing protein [Sulfitobacter brevis]SFD72288.1 OST-HTH/LOTUS domain-containing protein [Sulfitobacter brevis]